MERLKNKKGNLFYQADALWTYNPKSNILVMYEINSDDIPMTHSGKLSSPTTIYVERFDGSGTVIQQSVIELKDKNTMRFMIKYFESGKSNKTEWILKRRE